MNAKPGFVFSPLIDIIAKRGAKLGVEVWYNKENEDEKTDHDGRGCVCGLRKAKFEQIKKDSKDLIDSFKSLFD